MSNIVRLKKIIIKMHVNLKQKVDIATVVPFSMAIICIC